MIIVTSKNNELPLKNQVVYEVSEGPSGKSVSPSNANGQPALSVRNTVISAGNSETISTQSSLFDTLSVDMSGPSSASSASSSSSSASSNLVGGSSSSSSWPSTSVSMGKGASGRKPPTMNHTGPKNLILLTTYHQYLLGLGVLSICVGFIRALASIFLLWNSVEKVCLHHQLDTVYLDILYTHLVMRQLFDIIKQLRLSKNSRSTKNMLRGGLSSFSR